MALSGAASCRPVEVEEPDVTASVDHVFASFTVMKALPMVHALYPAPGHWHLVAERTCAMVDSIVGDTAGFPAGGAVTVHLRYPDEGCADLDGRSRSGRLTITLTGAMDEPGSSITVRSPRLGLDGFAHRFTMAAECTEAGIWEVNVDTSDVFWQGDWSRRLSGAMTLSAIGHEAGQPAAMEQRYTLEHTLDGQDRRGVRYASRTSAGMVIANDCRWVLSGVEVITPSGSTEQVLDHGAGTCDASSTITSAGRSIGLTSP